MTDRLHRIAAIVKADFLIRFRRISTLVVFLILSALAYLWVPDPSTGRALIQIEGRRALYNSAAIGIATASLGTLFIGLAGFYVVSNALRRDVTSRCGFVIASTTMRGGEYLFGKFLGNIVFLSTFMAGFMAASMAMLVVRGEASLEPWVFAKQYLMMAPPSIVFVSVLAILFESIPWLSGRLGDVLYFFVWVASLGIVVNMMENAGAPPWLAALDFSGLGLLFVYIKSTFQATSLSLGSSSFDASKPLFVMDGIPTRADWVLLRMTATVASLPLLGVARLFFHRFDSARVRTSAAKHKRGWIARINGWLEPLTRLVPRIASLLPARSLGASALADAHITLTGFPIFLAAAVFIAVASIASPHFREGVMPVAFAVAAIAVANVASRERRAGTLALAYASPKLKERFVWWKLGSSLAVAAVILAVPFARIVLTQPASMPALIVGILFVCAGATAFGIISSNPKAFLLVFLTFWYVVTNDRGLSPELDFAGFYGTATLQTVAVYAALAVGLLAAAELFHRQRMMRE